MTPRIIFLTLALIGQMTVAQASFDVATGTITNEHWRSGVPQGGIGCGKLEICPDGWLGYYTGNHNWDRPTGPIPGAFFALYAVAGEKRAARMLRLPGKAEYGNVQNAVGIAYSGWFPFASLHYNDPALPVEASLRAWSPLIPQDVPDSSLPVACYRFTVHNPQAVAAHVSLAISWPNLIGYGGDKGKKYDDYSGNKCEQIVDGNFAGVLYTKRNPSPDLSPNVLGSYALCTQASDLQITRIPDYDSSASNLAFWPSFSQNGVPGHGDPADSIKSPASGLVAQLDLPANATRDIDFVLVWHFPSDVGSFKSSPIRSDKFATSSDNVRAAFDGNPGTRWSTNRIMMAGDTFTLDLGKTQKVAKVVLDSAASPGDYPRGYRLEGSLDGASWTRLAVDTSDHVDTVVQQGALTISFPQTEARYVRIVQTGDAPGFVYWSIHELRVYDPAGNEYSRDGWDATATLAVSEPPTTTTEDFGQFYSNKFSDALQIAKYVLSNEDSLAARTLEWQGLIRKSNMPDWLKLKLVNNACAMICNSILTKDGRFTQLESPIDMEGALGTMDQRMASHALDIQWFPSLDETELRIYAHAQDLARPSDGRITHFVGNIHETVGDPNVGYGVTDWPDLSASWLLQVLKLYRWTGDRAFLDEMWPHAKRALTFLAAADKDGDGIPEGGSSYDYERVPRGAFIYNAICYLGALRAGHAMAQIEGDTALVSVYDKRFKAAKHATMTELWNGKFFKKYYNPRTGESNPNSFIAALAGDWLARLSCEKSLLAPDVIDSAIRQIIARHVKPFPIVPPMEVTPEGKIVTESCYLLQHEPYVGCEAIDLGYTDDGLDTIKRVYDIAWTIWRDPWHEALAYNAPYAGGHGLNDYMTRPASWHVLNALSGTTVDLGEHTLYVSPRPSESMPEIHMPLFFSRFWLWLDYAPKPQTLTLRVLKTFGAPTTLTTVSAGADCAAIKLPTPFEVVEGRELNLSADAEQLVTYPKSKTVDFAVIDSSRANRPGLPSTDWKAYSELDDIGRTRTYELLDGDPATRWTTGRPMQPGDAVVLDFGKAISFKKVVLDSSASKGDYPRGCTVLTSPDGSNWTSVLNMTEEQCTRSVKDGVLDLKLPQTTTRYLKIVQNGTVPGLFWSIHELYVY